MQAFVRTRRGPKARHGANHNCCGFAGFVAGIVAGTAVGAVSAAAGVSEDGFAIGAMAGAAPSVDGAVTGVTGIATAGALVPSGAGMVAEGLTGVVCVVDSVTVGVEVVGAACGSNMFSAIAIIKYTTNTETVPTVSASPVRPPKAVSVPPPPPKALASPPPCGR